MRFVSFFILALTLSTCKAPAPKAESSLDSESFDVISKYLINFIFQFSDYKKLCDVVKDIQVVVNGVTEKQAISGFAGCVLNTKETLCEEGVKRIQGVFEQSIETATKDSEFTEGVIDDFESKNLSVLKSSVAKCITGAAPGTLKSLSKLIADKLGISIASIMEMAKKAVMLKQELAKWACTGGSKAIGDAISSARTVDFDNACSSASAQSAEAKKSRLASCFRTAGSICDVAVSTGRINVDNFLPDSDNVAVDIAASLASEVASGACKLGATATQKSCALINAAAEQIKMAILTGDNDWANCAGTTQLGTCLGKTIGSRGWTNTNGVESVQTSTDPETQKNFEFTGCCLCDYNKFNAGLFSDALVESYQVISVIQQGDFETGNCAYRENRGRFSIGNGQRAQYQNCQKRYLAGNRCAADTSGIARVWNGNSYDSVPVRQF
jgi:hypothetical protein